MTSPSIPYQPFWCEENIWHLAGHPAPGAGERLVLVITGVEAGFACWNQRAGPPEGPILWDYHVVLAVRSAGWRIWDLDTRLGAPLPVRTWLSGTFPEMARVRPAFHPRFAMFTAAEWRDGFGSDRSHMRNPDGGWQQPPPPWPMLVGADLTVTAAIDRARAGLDLDGVRARFEDEGASR